MRLVVEPHDFEKFFFVYGSIHFRQLFSGLFFLPFGLFSSSTLSSQLSPPPQLSAIKQHPDDPISPNTGCIRDLNHYLPKEPLVSIPLKLESTDSDFRMRSVSIPLNIEVDVGSPTS